MELRHAIVGGIMIAIVLAAGCVPSAPETAEPVEPPTAQTVPTATDQNAVNTDTPAPVATTGPAMQVGSTFYYVDGTTLVAVPAGEFKMGANGEDNPEHPIHLDDFWIYSTKVTNQQYALCEAFGKCTPPDRKDNPKYKDINFANHPVVGVTYDQAAAYCSFVHGRLPTEAEWEKTARDPQGSPYPWGKTDPSCDLLNFNNCTDGTSSVVSYPTGASYYGGLDMAGNAFEWVADWYAADYYASSPEENPQGPSQGTSRSVRSSSYASDAVQTDVTSRSSEDPASHRPDLGFRCVIDEPTYFASSCTSPLIYVAEGNMTPSAATCPEVKIQQGAYCVGKLPVTNVTFQGPADATFDAPNCTPSDKPNLFTCASPGTIISIAAGCQVDQATGKTSCPSGFTQKDTTCIASGSAGECLTGSYDSTWQCCQMAETTDALSTSKVCPVGTFYAPVQDACLSYPVQELVSITEHVIFLSCKETKSGGGGGGGSCQPPPGSQCPHEYLWDTNLCCCRVEYDPNATYCQPLEPIPTEPPIEPN